MRIDNQRDVSSLVSVFQKSVSENIPSAENMIEEVRLMNFKLKSIAGDVLVLNFKNQKFIEVLWRLGKLDEFYQENIRKVKKQDKNIFIKVFDQMYKDFHRELNSVPMRSVDPDMISAVFEVEIYKERINKSN